MSSPLISYVNDIRSREPKAKSFFISFYAIGAVGLAVPFTSPVFLFLTPLALVLSMVALAIYHRDKFDVKTLFIFSSIFTISFTIEAIGVSTGIVFGEYVYGAGLGSKLFGTPILIGLNWVMLVYLSASIINRFKLNPMLSILLGSSIMLAYDFIMEPIAPWLDMWEWAGGTIPLQNYAVWFLLAILFHAMLRFFRIGTRNGLAPTILLCQSIFFLFLLILTRFLPIG